MQYPAVRICRIATVLTEPPETGALSRVQARGKSCDVASLLTQVVPQIINELWNRHMIQTQEVSRQQAASQL